MASLKCTSAYWRAEFKQMASLKCTSAYWRAEFKQMASLKYSRLYRKIEPHSLRRIKVQERFFYFISNEFYKDFPDPCLMKNKEVVNGQRHDRPCFFAITDRNCADLFWFIPISSKVEKYKKYYRQKMKKYGKCDTIYFADVLGHERAFLIQNMFPITRRYVTEIYVDHNTANAVKVPDEVAKDIVKKARGILKLHKRGVHIFFADVDSIYEKQLKILKPVRVERVDAEPEHTPWNDLLIHKTHQREKLKAYKRDCERDGDDD